MIGYQIMATHQFAHALERGFNAVILGWVFGLGGACTVAGNVLGGTRSDRWVRETVFAVGSAIGMAGIGCLGWLEGPQDLFLLLGSYQIAFAAAALAIGASAVAAWNAAPRRAREARNGS